MIIIVPCLKFLSSFPLHLGKKIKILILDQKNLQDGIPSLLSAQSGHLRASRDPAFFPG